MGWRESARFQRHLHKSKMAVPSTVVAALRILTSTPSQELPLKERHDFETLLSKNLQSLKVSLREDAQFQMLRGVLEKPNSEDPESLTRESLSSGEPNTNECHETGRSGDKVELSENAGKYITRWKFVQMCLTLLDMLQESLMAARKKNKETPEGNEKGKKKSKEAPPLAPDSLSVVDQKAALTTIQLVVTLGICPNLLPGVGIPLERRSGFAHLFKMDEDLRRNERHLYQCVECLVSCIQHPALGSLVLSRHLGDVLASLLQICYAPLSSYMSNNMACRTTSTSSIEKTVQSGVTDPMCKDTTDIESNTSPESGRSTETGNSILGIGSQIVSPADILHRSSAISEQSSTLADKHSFIISSEREKCSDMLLRLLTRVYQPIVVRELLILQGGSASGRPSKKEVKSSDTCLNKGLRENSGKSGKAVLKKPLQRAPQWMRDVCGNLLSEILMKPHGVQGVLRGILEAPGGNLVLCILCVNSHDMSAKHQEYCITNPLLKYLT